MIGRIVIDDIRPRTPTGDYPAKAIVGEAVVVTADVFKDGHDVLAARVLWRPLDKKNWSEARMAVENAGLDRWTATVVPSALGAHEFVIEAWTDEYATWRHKAQTKLDAGQEIETELEEGARLIDSRAKKLDNAEDKAHLQMVVRSLRDKAATQAERLAPAFTPPVERLLDGPTNAKTGVTKSAGMSLWVDRERALYGAWYEFFPRSEGGLRGARDRLAAVADMGFDVVYFPPIHPIGRQFRKGPNNTLTATESDPGSPWAIGGAEGGHTDIHPELGTFSDFEDVVHQAREVGVEIALDYALQCSPDHPWVTEHPEWFHHRPDGSIAYAENPPKKYQDIYPINFWPAKEADRKALWSACKEILDFWIAKGVHIFRVDNPHTKPMAFWEWCIAAVQAEHPDVLFLAEAFTRPKVMAKLAEVGFTQSYTYFTWRTGSEEIGEYVEELAHSAKTDFMRPNFWPNTPDILAHPLRNGTPAAFKIRAALAALLSPSYGIYSGYELLENEPMSDANEEYFHSEKYEVRARNWDDPRSIADFLTELNAIRRRHPALHRLRNITLEESANPAFLTFTKQSEDGDDTVLVVVNLDPWNTQETTITVGLDALGLPLDRPYEAFDELTGQSFTWQGPSQYIRLDPYHQVAHVLHLRSLS